MGSGNTPTYALGIACAQCAYFVLRSTRETMRDIRSSFSIASRPLRIASAALLFAGAAQLGAQPLAPVRYTVRIPAPATHYLDVEASYPASGGAALELMMPVWTPGSYLVREFARNVEGIRATSSSGKELSLHKTRKNRWAIESPGTGRVTVNYRVYAHERAGRLDWVEESFALINGAPTYLTLVEQAHRPHDVRLVLPAGWRTSTTSLPAAADGGANHSVAADYDELVDSPIVAGNPQVREFTVLGTSHYLVNVGDSTLWNTDRAVTDLGKLVVAEHRLWGVLPYAKYVFFNFLVDSYDGIEHKGSTVLFADRRSTQSDSGYHRWIGLAAHEFTHAWNVKRLRPLQLGPFDYENENYTPSLWIAEGITDYYSWLLPARTGLATRAQALSDVSSAIRTLQTRPGRLVQTLSMASSDAWIKQYRPDENSVNTSISYYTKGSLVGLLLDARIRHLSNGTRSLDDVMRAAYARYSGAHGYTPAEFQAVASEVAGTTLRPFFHSALETVDELDYSEMLDWYGLRFDGMPDRTDRATLGVPVRPSDGHWILGNISRDAPVYGSGLDAGDEVLAVDDAHVAAGGVDALVRTHRPGDRVTLLVSRLGEELRVPVTLGVVRGDRWTLAARPDASAEQRAHLAAWLDPR
jgi:predicted metalloprotease with PDZ domain